MIEFKEPCPKKCLVHKYHCGVCNTALGYSPANYASRSQDIPGHCFYCGKFMPQENKDWKLDFEQVIWPHTLAILYDNQIGSAGAASLVKKETMGFIQSLLDKQREPEICICAAIKLPDGLILRGHRHADCFDNLAGRPKYKGKHVEAEQGFVTSKNRFVDRVEGYRLQHEAGIESAERRGYTESLGELFSEDLY